MEEGEPPTPNGMISLNLSNAGNTAYLNEGFEIPFSSDADIVGAYLQFKSNEGDLADTYYDVNIASNESGKQSAKKLRTKKGLFGHTSKVDDAKLDVDFNAQIEPGTFCYVICVYDGQGNISAPSEVCVTVESWGGNDAVIARWAMVKEEYTSNGETSTFNLGDPDCDEWTASCANEQEVEMSVCYTQEYGILELKSDGSYTVDFKGYDQNYDDDAFSQCQLEYTDDTLYRYQSNGNWAYVGEEDRLTLVEYGFTVDEDGETETQIVPSGDAELMFNGTVELNGNSFVITENQDYDGDGIVDSSYKIFFEKQ